MDEGLKLQLSKLILNTSPENSDFSEETENEEDLDYSTSSSESDSTTACQGNCSTEQNYWKTFPSQEIHFENWFKLV